MKFIKEQKLKILIILLLALLLSLFIEIRYVMFEERYSFSGKNASVLESDICEPEISGYEVYNGNHYVPTTNTPQLVLWNAKMDVQTVFVIFKEKSMAPINCNFYYATDGDFSHERMIIKKIQSGEKSVVFTIPEKGYDDFDISINAEFTIEDIILIDGTVENDLHAVSSFSILRTLLMFVCAAALAILFLSWFLSKNPRKLLRSELLLLFLSFCYYYQWAVSKEYNYAPDEAMRYDVTLFLFKNNRLPINDELLSSWGFSYAHTPTVLCNQLGYVLMKIAYLFSTKERALLISARMVSVISCTLAVYFLIKITKIIFKTPARWIAIVTFAFMPQFAFIASYVNNDSLAILGISLIIYSWVLGMTDNWNIKNSLLLVSGLSICIMSYYNSYGWVLLSVIFCIASYLLKNKKDYKGLLKLGGLVAGLTFLCAGHIFIRHLILYGDMLGFEISNYYAELYSIEELRPGNRIPLIDKGVSFFEMLFDRGWIEISYKSFIAGFGYMSVFAENEVYFAVTCFALIALVGCIYGVIDRVIKKRRPENIKLLFYILLIAGSLITIALSMYYSYCSDYQPQGRYCYPAFVAIVLIAAWGYDSLISLIKANTHKYAVISMVCTAFIAISLYVYYNIYIPSGV